MAAQDINFRTSDNVTLRGWLIKPKDIAVAQKLPCLIMSSGFTATIEIELKTFAEKLTARAPISCLVYDHRGFGYSDAKEGQPRQEVVPSQQISDMSDAITYAQSRPDVDADRVGLWGTSYSGGHVLHVGAFDRRAKIVLSQVPCIDGWANMHRLIGPDQWAEVNKSWQADRLARAAGSGPKMLPVVSENAAVASALPTPDSFAWFHPWAEKTNWVNAVTQKSLEAFREYVPAANIHRISPTPVLLTVADNDTLCPTDLALEAFAQAREPKQLHLFPGGHFDVYSDTIYDSNVDVQAAFIKKYLLH